MNSCIATHTFLDNTHFGNVKMESPIYVLASI
jgi:hypothetical protein